MLDRGQRRLHLGWDHDPRAIGRPQARYLRSTSMESDDDSSLASQKAAYSYFNAQRDFIRGLTNLETRAMLNIKTSALSLALLILKNTAAF